MKKITRFSLFLFAISLVFNACQKEDNPRFPELTRFPLPQVVKVAGTDQVISALDPDAFNGKFTVGLYFPDDVLPQKFDVVVIKNSNPGNVKLIKADVTNFPSEITITGSQLEDLFGEPIVVGDKFDISVDVTTSTGQKFEAFPATGNSYAAGIAAQPGSSTLIRYESVCQYDPDIFQGAFEVVTDEWADYATGEAIQLTKIDATHFSFQYKAADPRPIIVAVNPTTNSVSVAKQVYGSGYPPGWPYGDISCESVPGVDNFVAPCDKVFSIVLKHTVAAGSFGTYKLVVKKD